MDDGNGSGKSAARWQWTYRELLRIERARTDELQSQQQRIATVLVANGLLLAFLAAAVATGRPHDWQERVELAAVVLLAMAVLAGLCALVPVTPDRNEATGHELPASARASLFLDPAWFVEIGVQANEIDVLETLCASLRVNIDENHYAMTIKWRKRLLRVQLALIAIAAGLLAVAMFGSAVQ